MGYLLIILICGLFIGIISYIDGWMGLEDFLIGGVLGMVIGAVIALVTSVLIYGNAETETYKMGEEKIHALQDNLTVEGSFFSGKR